MRIQRAAGIIFLSGFILIFTAGCDIFSPTTPFAIGSTRVSLKDGMVLMVVPSGDFLMGALTSDTKAGDDEKPQHTADLDTYWIDKTEVTNAQYQKCAKAGACTTPYETKSSTRSSYYANPDFANYPVVSVDWNQANNYCRWAGRRLPSEAEWEKAARGTEGRLYPWGNDLPGAQLLNFNKIVNDTTEAGLYPQGASLYGVLDLAGNVWEWVNDWYQSNYYQNSPLKNPKGPASGTERVLRGGSWYLSGWVTRSSYRFWLVPESWYNDIGFRCADSS